MSLRKTTLLFITLALVGLSVVLLHTQRVNFALRFSDVERSTALENTSRALALLDAQTAALEDLCSLAARQDTADLAALPSASLDLLLDYGPEGLRTARVFNALDQTWETPQPADLRSLTNPPPAGAGLLWAQDRPLLAAHCLREGGSLLLGRYLDGTRLVEMGEPLYLGLSVLPAPPDPTEEEWSAALPGGQPVRVRFDDELNLTSLTPLPVLDAQAAGWLQLHSQRSINATGRLLRGFLTVSLFISAVVFGATILFVLEGMVLGRVSRLNREVTHIGSSEDLSARVSVDHNDELTRLSENINRMLERLEQAQLRRDELLEQVSAAQADLKRLSGQLVEVQEAERRRLALELHDEIGQLLTGLKLMLDSGGQPDCAGRARELVNELIARVRQLSLELRPALLDDLGLLPALLWLADRFQQQTGMEVTLRHSGLQDRRFPAQVETAAYRIVQEALTNAARHSDAGQVQVQVWAGTGALSLQISDQGAGFDPQQFARGAPTTGLPGMRERAALLDGDFELQTAPGQGTCVTVTLPLPGEEVPA